MQAIRVLVLLACLMVGVPEAWALELTLQGDWIPSAVDATNLQAGAGSPLNPEYESPTTQGVIDLTGTSGSGDAWRVDVKRTDTSWPAGVSISVKRWDDGTGLGSISGGLSYQPVELTERSFFSGTGDRFDIHVQLKTGNFSLQVPPGAYSTTLTYTVVDL